MKFIIGVALFATIAIFIFVPTYAQTPPTPTVIGISAPTLPPSPFPSNTPRVFPTLTPTPLPGDHFWLSRPFAYDPTGQIRDYPARGYVYGSTAGNTFQTHHGIDIENVRGIWVRAMEAGTVLYAGDDTVTMFGPKVNFYGNLVVIQHNFLSPDGQPVFSLYGHLNEVKVETGSTVALHDTIGAVGATGVAIGPHLHVEVRVGNPYDYYSTYNPELWIKPWQGYGAFAARILDRNGLPVFGKRVELIGMGEYFTGWTYADEGVNGDPQLQENIVIGDMPAGEYDIKVGEIRNVLYRGKVTITADGTAFYEIILNY